MVTTTAPPTFAAFSNKQHASPAFGQLSTPRFSASQTTTDTTSFSSPSIPQFGQSKNLLKNLVDKALVTGYKGYTGLVNLKNNKYLPYLIMGTPIAAAILGGCTDPAAPPDCVGSDCGGGNPDLWSQAFPRNLNGKATDFLLPFQHANAPELVETATAPNYSGSISEIANSDMFKDRVLGELQTNEYALPGTNSFPNSIENYINNSNIQAAAAGNGALFENLISHANDFRPSTNNISTSMLEKMSEGGETFYFNGDQPSHINSLDGAIGSTFHGEGPNGTDAIVLSKDFEKTNGVVMAPTLLNELLETDRVINLTSGEETDRNQVAQECDLYISRIYGGMLGAEGFPEATNDGSIMGKLHTSQVITDHFNGAITDAIDPSLEGDKYFNDDMSGRAASGNNTTEELIADAVKNRVGTEAQGMGDFTKKIVTNVLELETPYNGNYDNHLLENLKEKLHTLHNDESIRTPVAEALKD